MSDNYKVLTRKVFRCEECGHYGAAINRVMHNPECSQYKNPLRCPTCDTELSAQDGYYYCPNEKCGQAPEEVADPENHHGWRIGNGE